MERNPFLNLQDEMPPQKIADSIRERIVNVRKTRVRLGIAGNISLFLVSTFAIFPAFNYLRAETQTSGFLEYISLAFSGNTIFSYWADFGASLVESLPTVGIALTFATLFGALWGLRGFMRMKRTSVAIPSFVIHS